MEQAIVSGRQQRVLSFVWQHTLLLISLYLMTLGVALCVRSALGSSVISSLPLAMALAGEAGKAAPWTVGTYTVVMNFIFVGMQIAILRRRFEAVQLFQLLIGFVFGALIDLNMMLVEMISCDTLPMQILLQFAGCTVMGVGIAFEVKCGSVTMPGEGITMAICRVSGGAFPKVKIIVDTVLVLLAVMAGYFFFGRWMWNVTGVGTLFAMVYVGMVVKIVSAHIGWFDCLLNHVPGFERIVIGLRRLF